MLASADLELLVDHRAVDALDLALSGEGHVDEVEAGLEAAGDDHAAAAGRTHGTQQEHVLDLLLGLLLPVIPACRHHSHTADLFSYAIMKLRKCYENTNTLIVRCKHIIDLLIHCPWNDHDIHLGFRLLLHDYYAVIRMSLSLGLQGACTDQKP
jgi:hypothetical protein